VVSIYFCTEQFQLLKETVQKLLQQCSSGCICRDLL